MAKWVFILLSLISFSVHANFDERYVCEATGISVELLANQREGQLRLIYNGRDMILKFNHQFTQQYPRTSWFDRISGTPIECCGPVDIGITTIAGLNSGLRPGLPILQIYSPGLIASQILTCQPRPL